LLKNPPAHLEAVAAPSPPHRSHLVCPSPPRLHAASPPHHHTSHLSIKLPSGKKSTGALDREWETLKLTEECRRKLPEVQVHWGYHLTSRSPSPWCSGITGETASHRRSSCRRTRRRASRHPTTRSQRVGARKTTSAPSPSRSFSLSALPPSPQPSSSNAAAGARTTRPSFGGCEPPQRACG
jgi:hypothetical protein